MFSYFAYGLRIRSALPIPEFVPTELKCDVSIYIEKHYTLTDYVPSEVLEQLWSLKLNREEAVVYFKGIGVFLVQGGSKIIIIPTPDASEQLIRFYLVGTIMAILLYQRGLLVLHGSVVNINSGAVTFLGTSGAGKSSTTAALHARGHGIIADDVAAVTLGTEPATVSPGFPQIKLGREIATFLGYNFESLLLLHPQHEKRAYRMTQEFSQEPVPIRRIYILAEDTELCIEPISTTEAVIELVRHSRPTTLFHCGGAAHFLQCAALAKELTIYRLKRPRSLGLLPDLAKLVEEHVAYNV